MATQKPVRALRQCSHWAVCGTQGGAAARRARAGHLFGPSFIRSRNPCFLHGPFPGGDMGNAPFPKFPYWGLFQLLTHFGCGIFELSPPFTHFPSPFSPHHGEPEKGRGDVAILICPHHGDPEKARVMSPFHSAHTWPPKAASFL